MTAPKARKRTTKPLRMRPVQSLVFEPGEVSRSVGMTFSCCLLMRSLLLFRQFFFQVLAPAIQGRARTEIVHFEDLADFDLSLGMFAVRRRSALGPFDCLSL